MNTIINFYRYGSRVLRLPALILLLCSTVACDSFTEVDLPSSQLAAPAVYESNATATAALMDIYAKIRDRGLLTGYATGVSQQLGLYSDELVMYGGDPSFYNNTVLPSSYEISELWNSSYNQVYAANAVIGGVSSSSSLSASEKGLLRGEALFIRALVHFYLANTFGDVPYVTSADFNSNRQVQKSNQDQLYDHLKSDLTEAISLLPENYISPLRIRPNKAAAQALLARVCLYSGDWPQAADLASAVLNRDDLYQLTAIEDTFLKEAASTIWQLAPEKAGDNTLEAATFSFTFGPPPLAALSQELYDAFPEGDLRKTYWVTEVAQDSNIWYHASKYDAVGNSGNSLEHSIVMRISEMYLIRAEARAQQGELIGAVEDLNSIRNNAGLAAITPPTAETILNAILLERRLELFTEYGHRFFDLKRRGKLDETLSLVKPGWQATDRNLPLPESELMLNENLLPQNDGY
ncbi:RagB/SusD family nutrient uptake outer membrane protein [Flavobacterium sp. RHBU_24]|uniref:RagB/SusD family nutrient uptake outer membrane protein n=1 Tax=Flavobacterium sp. RHBU_24 TaxID=3391185 RepID=UPI00398484E9